MWFVVLPQAFRIAIPPIGNQYLNLIKNSSLGAAIGYYDLTLVDPDDGRQRLAGRAGVRARRWSIYIADLAGRRRSFVNIANRRLALVER